MALAISDLRQRFYDLMDEGQNQNYISVALANQFINNAAGLLHNFIVTENPWFFYSDVTYSPLLNVADYPLPADFRNALKVYALLQPLSSGAPRYIPMRQFNAGNFSVQSEGITTWSGPYTPIPRYRILGQNLRLDPAPTVAPVSYSVVMWYTPQFVPVTTTTGTFADLFLPGHEQWIVNQAVIYAKIKEEVPFTDIAAMNEAIKAEIRRDLAMRDHGGGDAILDTEGLLDDNMCYQWR